MGSQTQRKLVILSVKEKYEVVQKLLQGKKQAELVTELGISASVICRIRKNSNTIINQYMQGKGGVKKFKKASLVEVDEALLKWIRIMSLKKVKLTSDLCITQANSLAAKLGFPNWTCSLGWFNRFKKRHQILTKKFKDQSNDDERPVAENFSSNCWPGSDENSNVNGARVFFKAEVAEPDEEEDVQIRPSICNKMYDALNEPPSENDDQMEENIDWNRHYPDVKLQHLNKDISSYKGPKLEVLDSSDEEMEVDFSTSQAPELEIRELGIKLGSGVSSSSQIHPFEISETEIASKTQKPSKLLQYHPKHNVPEKSSQYLHRPKSHIKVILNKNIGIAAHWAAKPWKCQKCGSRYKLYKNLEIHKRDPHCHLAMDNPKKLICKLCDYSAKDHGLFAEHTRIHTEFPDLSQMSLAISSQGPAPMSPVTPATVRSSGQKSIIPPYSRWSNKLLYTGKGPYSCNACGRVLQRTHHMLRHIRQNCQGPKKPTRNSVDFISSVDPSTSINSTKAQEMSFPCKNCATTFPTESSLSDHLNLCCPTTHKPPQNFLNHSNVGVEFRRCFRKVGLGNKGDLNQRIKISKQYSCLNCTSSFKTENELDEHSVTDHQLFQTHQNDQISGNCQPTLDVKDPQIVLNCQFCAFTTTFPVALIEHNRIHIEKVVVHPASRQAPSTGGHNVQNMSFKHPALKRKVFSCPKCCKKFARNALMIVHTRVCTLPTHRLNISSVNKKATPVMYKPFKYKMGNLKPELFQSTPNTNSWQFPSNFDISNANQTSDIDIDYKIFP